MNSNMTSKMCSKLLLSIAALGFAAVAFAPADALAQDKRKQLRERQAVEDCKPYNGPHGYYGNPWCDGGFKYAEDYAPGTGPYFDLFDLPQVQRLRRRWE
jgi:hypothetical protein